MQSLTHASLRRTNALWQSPDKAELQAADVGAAAIFVFALTEQVFDADVDQVDGPKDQIGGQGKPQALFPGIIFVFESVGRQSLEHESHL